jgi:hypothetical protein
MQGLMGLFRRLDIFGVVVGLSATLAVAAPAKKAAPARAKKSPAVAAATAKPAPLVDSAKVRKYYLDGEFESAIMLLENSIAENNLAETKPLSHDDSVFIFKHLGVMYAARYETREKGKLYMHKLLMTEPTAKIMDMYASDMIYMIFKNIQDEFESNRMRLDRAENLLKGQQDKDVKKPDTVRVVEKKESSGGKGWIWAGAAVVAVGAGVGTYLMFSDEPKTVTDNSSF